MNFIKAFAIITLMILAFDVAAHEEVKCEIELKSRGVYFRYCPAGTVLDATSTTGNLSGGPYPHLFLRTEVRCVEPVIICEKIVDSETEEE